MAQNLKGYPSLNKDSDTGKDVTISEIGSNKAGLDTVVSDSVHGQDPVYSAFGHQVVAEEGIIGDYRLDTVSIFRDWNITQVGSGTYEVPNDLTGLQLSTGTTNNSSCQFYSKRTHYYESGTGIKVKVSTLLEDMGGTGIVRQWGYRDGNNGVYFEENAGVLYAVVLSNGVEVFKQASTAWDIPDTDWQYNNIWYMEFQWLGGGPIWFYKTDSNKKVRLVTTYTPTNTTSFSIATPDLKAFLCIQNTTSGTNAKLKIGCISVITQGGSTFVLTDEEPLNGKPALLGKSILTGQLDTDATKYVSVQTTLDKELKTYSKIDDTQFRKILNRLDENNEYQKLILEQLMYITGLTDEAESRR